MEEVFASVYIAEMVAEAGKAHSNNGAAGDVEAS
jgi:hypothetical protein